jgi:hypothetical protein
MRHLILDKAGPKRLLSDEKIFSEDADPLKTKSVLISDTLAIPLHHPQTLKTMGDKKMGEEIVLPLSASSPGIHYRL